MSITGSKTKTNSTTNQTSQTDPWDETIPLLKEFLGNLPKPQGETGAETKAFGDLSAIAGKGDPNAAAIQGVAKNFLGTQSRAPIVTDAYGTYQNRMRDVADGKNQDIGNDPHLQQLLTQVGDDAQNRTRAQFAAAGRDMSGMEGQTVARGTGQAQLPILMDQLNRERARTDAAAGNVFAAGNTTTSTAANADQAAAAMKMLGIDASKSALDAKTWGPSQILNLEQQKKSLPYSNLSMLAELLFPAAQLGEQRQGTSSTKGKSKSMGFGLKLI